MGCDPERVTGYVDAELSPGDLAAVERHLASCPVCAAQAAFEIDLRDRLRALPSGATGQILSLVAATRREAATTVGC